MGYNMHCALEALNKKTEKWECFEISSAERHYSLFSRIADVCNSEKEEDYIDPIDTPRGWPGDFSNPAETWRDCFELAFFDTWLSRKELEDLDKWLRENNYEERLSKLLNLKQLSLLFDMESGWKKAAFSKYKDLRVLFFFER